MRVRASLTSQKFDVTRLHYSLYLLVSYQLDEIQGLTEEQKISVFIAYSD